MDLPRHRGDDGLQSRPERERRSNTRAVAVQFRIAGGEFGERGDVDRSMTGEGMTDLLVYWPWVVTGLAFGGLLKAAHWWIRRQFNSTRR